MSEFALEVENLTVSYGEIAAVKGISFAVKSGEILTIIGANGAGKASTLRAISGMIPRGGTVRLNGEDLRGLSPDRLVRRGLAHVPEGRGIFGTLTVAENLRLGSWTRKDRKQVASDLEDVLTTFPRLRERLAQLAGTLSGGEQQMLAVGRALMSGAGLLLLDEPSMGLAPRLVHEIFDTLRKVNARGVTILLVEQNANLALQLAQHACLLETGQLALASTAEEMRSNPRVREAYLGT